MTTKLHVTTRGVWLGKLRLASFLKDSRGTVINYMIADGTHQKSRRYEEPGDCMWDAESEVRRLLQEEGVRLEQASRGDLGQPRLGPELDRGIDGPREVLARAAPDMARALLDVLRCQNKIKCGTCEQVIIRVLVKAGVPLP